MGTSLRGLGEVSASRIRSCVQSHTCHRRSGFAMRAMLPCHGPRSQPSFGPTHMTSHCSKWRVQQGGWCGFSEPGSCGWMENLLSLPARVPAHRGAGEPRAVGGALRRVGGRKQWGLSVPVVHHSASPRLAAQSQHPRLLFLGANKCLQATCGCHCGHCSGRLAHPPGSQGSH